MSCAVVDNSNNNKKVQISNLIFQSPRLYWAFSRGEKKSIESTNVEISLNLLSEKTIGKRIIILTERKAGSKNEHTLSGSADFLSSQSFGPLCFRMTVAIKSYVPGFFLISIFATVVSTFFRSQIRGISRTIKRTVAKNLLRLHDHDNNQSDCRAPERKKANYHGRTPGWISRMSFRSFEHISTFGQNLRRTIFVEVKIEFKFFISIVIYVLKFIRHAAKKHSYNKFRRYELIFENLKILSLVLSQLVTDSKEVAFTVYTVKILLQQSQQKVQNIFCVFSETYFY